MHSLGAQYFARFDEIVGRILNTEADKIAQAAGILAEDIGKGKLIYAWGTGGHDNRSAEELLWRAGGLACVAVILDPGLQLILGATKATKIERMPAYAKGVLDHYQLGKDDTLLLINSYGINALTIDAVHAHVLDRNRLAIRDSRGNGDRHVANQVHVLALCLLRHDDHEQDQAPHEAACERMPRARTG